MVKVKKIHRVGLIKGRHDIPVDRYIFDKIDDVTDQETLMNIAYHFIKKIDADVLEIYVTGLTVALIATLNVCKILGVQAVLHHYDRESETYYEQEVL